MTKPPAKTPRRTATKSKRRSASTFEDACARVEELVPTAFDTGAFAPLQSAVLEAIDAAHSAAQLWQLLSIDRLDDATFGEDEHPHETLEAVLARADSWGQTADAASAIALVVRASALDVAPPLLAKLDDGVKTKSSRVLDARARNFVVGLRSRCAPLRVSCAHALGRCRATTPSHATQLVKLATKEKDPSARAMMLLSAAAIVRRRRHGKLGPLDSHDSHTSPLVRACAAAARAMTGERLDARATAALAAVIATPSELPDEWGWRWVDGQRESTAAIGERVFAWAATDTPAIAFEAAATNPSWRMAEALVHLAFEDAAIPRLGLARDELTKHQRLALRIMADAPKGSFAIGGMLRRFGLFNEDWVEPFLAGTSPHWLPLEVPWSGGRRWHLWRLWREHVWGDVPLEIAVRALVDGLRPEQLVDAITVRTHVAYASVGDGIVSETGRERAAALVVSIAETLATKGRNPLPMLLALAANADQRDPPTLAFMLLAAARASDASVPDALDSLLAEGLGWAVSPIVGSAVKPSLPVAYSKMLAGLPARRRKAISQA